MEDSDSAVKAQLNESPQWDEENGHPCWGPKTLALASKILSRFQNIPYEDREDIIHDFAIKRLNMEGYGGRSKLSTWLRSCLTHMALDFLRKVNQTRTKEENRIVVESITEDKDHAANQLRQGCSPCLNTMEIAFYVMAKKGRFSNEPVELAAYLVAEVIKLAYATMFKRNSGAGQFLEPDEEGSNLPVELIGEHLLECDTCMELASKFEAAFHEHDLRLPYLVIHHLYSEMLAEDLGSPITFFTAGSHPQQTLQVLNQEINELLDEPGDPAVKRQRVCSNCKKPGHNARTCTEPKNSRRT